MSTTSTKPVLHYLDIGSLGRGEVVRLFLKDAGIDFEDVRYAYDHTWPATSEELKGKGITITGNVPALEYNGTILTQHIPTLRYLARELNDYDGQTSLEKWVVDAVADIYIDWRFQWVANLKNASDEYKNNHVPKYYKIIAHYYSQRGGPFLLGDRVTYTDFAVYQSIENDQKTGTLPETLPSVIETFKKAFESRPRVKSYLESGRIANVNQ
ncbi:uncharacterized protein BHQ10_000968 [Talaromyces amestolkiae]|uniref:Glutathione S-transferase n=1 Tax=Talaromyces amestolkiae TaxID=1196081 RepID=A0A364KN29_TALAM|nr:uncharacterized protein BHQ10_000968 [Talaromyces amestolkiae]RAO64956.1 hypothetical protein BHQ10_000968 [Talaromyces amestolkiae]